jgi:malonyl-CoA decarboxylase
MGAGVNTSFLQELLNTVAEQSRQLIPWVVGGQADIVALSKALMSSRGEASGVVIARQILSRYRQIDTDERREFFRHLAEDLAPHGPTVTAAANDYLADPTPQSLRALQGAVESPRQEFFRRLNLAPGATAEIVAMRQWLQDDEAYATAAAEIDPDLAHLLSSWFNRGFLVLRRIDWQTPAAILEKIIAYEAVHEIRGWDDLRRRLDPTDRRCYAFFHPSLVDEPLIFVEVALMAEEPDAISSVLEEATKNGDAARPNTAVFYSISNCQEGLRGISFGNFLIKQVVEELARELPSLKSFVTLSPVPGFARWLNAERANGDSTLLTQPEKQVLSKLDSDWLARDPRDPALKSALLTLAAQYLVVERGGDGRARDSVARFHLGNGARLSRINWPADTSAKGVESSFGVMVNYRYDLKEIERNHEAYVNDGEIAASRRVRSLIRPRVRHAVEVTPALPAP